MSGDFFVSD